MKHTKLEYKKAIMNGECTLENGDTSFLGIFALQLTSWMSDDNHPMSDDAHELVINTLLGRGGCAKGRRVKLRPFNYFYENVIKAFPELEGL